MVLLIVFFVLKICVAQSKPRARDLGVPFDGNPGRWNAITDVKGVEVGVTTLISGEGKLQVGSGPVRTGVTAILPRGKNVLDSVFAGWFTLNGNGEMTGTTWVEDSGFLEGPVMITNTHSVGVVRDAVIRWRVKRAPPDEQGYWWSLPVVAETWDGYLNDINGFHVKPDDVFHALDSAQGGPVPEGNTGGGTGMICNEFKGGTGAASRVLEAKHGGYTVGVLVQCNYGARDELRIAGVPVGREIPEQGLERGCGIDHRRGGHGRSPDSYATEAGGAQGFSRPGARWQLFRGWLGRHLPGVFHGKRRCRGSEGSTADRYAAERATGPDFFGDGAGDGGGGYQRHGGCGNPDRRE
jgi:hypothetical protein